MFYITYAKTAKYTYTACAMDTINNILNFISAIIIIIIFDIVTLFSSRDETRVRHSFRRVYKVDFTRRTHLMDIILYHTDRNATTDKLFNA